MSRLVDAEEKDFIAQSKPKTDGGSMAAPPIPWRSIIREATTKLLKTI